MNTNLNYDVKVNANQVLKLKKTASYGHLKKTMILGKWLDNSIMELYFMDFNECNRAGSTKPLFVNVNACEFLKHGSSDIVREQLL